MPRTQFSSSTVTYSVHMLAFGDHHFLITGVQSERHSLVAMALENDLADDLDL